MITINGSTVKYPSDIKESLVQVFYTGKEGEIFVCGMCGAFTPGSIMEILGELENPDSELPFFTHGPGDYLLSVSRVEDQVDELGRVELVGYNFYRLVAFRTNDPIAEDL